MKVIYDARHIRTIYSGLARYTYGVLVSLIKSDIYSYLEIILDKNELYDKNPLFIDIKQHAERKGRYVKFVFLDAPLFGLRHHLAVSSYVNRAGCDIYFYPHFDLPFWIRKRSIFVVHDLLPLIIHNYFLKYKAIKRLYFKYMIYFNLKKKNTICIAVSKSTKEDILCYIDKADKRNIKVVYEGTLDKPVIQGPIRKEILNLLNKKYLLYVGDRRPHKNLKEMIDIFNALKSKYGYDGYFLIVGDTKNFDFCVESYVANNNYIKLIGPVSDMELIELYKNMEALFFLSKYEGFGLPIVEAAKYNKKIIVSDVGSCSELAPKNALKLPLQLATYNKAKLIHEYLSNTILIDNSDYILEFSWEQSVKEIFKCAGL